LHSTQHVQNNKERKIQNTKVGSRLSKLPIFNSLTNQTIFQTELLTYSVILPHEFVGIKKQVNKKCLLAGGVAQEVRAPA
jgi:hypothetical protein